MASGREDRLESNIQKLHIFKFLGAFTLFTPVVVLFFQANNLSMTEIMILQSAYSVALILLEVPSGYASDILGRRKTLISASSFLAFGIGIYSIGTGFWSFLLAELTFAVGGALKSGSDSAMMYDTLKEIGKEKRYKKIWGKATYYALIATAIASITGGIIAEYNLRYTLTFMVPVFLAMIPLSYSMKEPERKKKVAEEGHFTEIMKTARETFLHNKRLRWLIVYSAILVMLVKGGYFLYQPYFKQVSIPVAQFGAIFAALNVFSALASRYSERIETFLGLKKSLISLIIITGLGFLLFGQITVYYSFAFAFLHNFVRGFQKPVLSDYINKITDSQDRSTVISLQSLTGRIVYATTIPLIGLITDSYGLLTAMNALAITSFALGGTIIGIMIYDDII